MIWRSEAMPQVSQANDRVRIVVASQKYYKGLYGDISNRYLGGQKYI